MYLVAFLFVTICTVLVCLNVFSIKIKTGRKEAEIDNETRTIYKVFLIVCVIIVFVGMMLPIAKDSKYIYNKEYKVDHGIVYREAMRKGSLGLFKSIIVTVDGQEYVYRVLYNDDNIKKGDSVRITYLPNTTWSVVEKEESIPKVD